MSALDINYILEKEMPYPNIILGGDAVKQQDLNYLVRVLNCSSRNNNTEDIVHILYPYDEENMLCLGKMTRGQVCSLGSTLDMDLTGYLDSNTFLEDRDDVITVLGTVF